MDKLFAVATKAAVVDSGKMLVLFKTAEERAGDRSSDPADLPGGRLEHGEDLVESLRREVREETGFDVAVERVIHAWGFTRGDGVHLVMLLYLCRRRGGEVILSREHDRHRWISLADAGDLPAWIAEAAEKALTSPR